MAAKLIIGLGFQIGCGKDTVADFLCDMAPFVKLRFADALKEAVCGIFGWDRPDLEDLDFKMAVDEFWGETPRTVLQRFGTEAMRNNFRQDIWVKALERRIAQSVSRCIVIPDMRFMNEVEAIKAWGGYTVRVIRPDWTPPNATPDQLKHPSETELLDYDGWDVEILNNSDLSQLKRATETTLRVMNGIHKEETS